MYQVEHETDLTNFGTWWHDNNDRLFRFWVYKKDFNSHTENNVLEGQSQYTDDYCSFGHITEAAELPDGDILLGFTLDDRCGNKDDEPYIEYHKLSEIDLAYYPLDETGYRD